MARCLLLALLFIASSKAWKSHHHDALVHATSCPSKSAHRSKPAASANSAELGCGRKNQVMMRGIHTVSPDASSLSPFRNSLQEVENWENTLNSQDITFPISEVAYDPVSNVVLRRRSRGDSCKRTRKRGAIYIERGYSTCVQKENGFLL